VAHQTGQRFGRHGTRRGGRRLSGRRRRLGQLGAAPLEQGIDACDAHVEWRVRRQQTVQPRPRCGGEQHVAEGFCLRGAQTGAAGFVADAPQGTG
jgi:hypothetical protein